LFSLDNYLINILHSFSGNLPKHTRAAPPPPPTTSSSSFKPNVNNNAPAPTVTLNPEHVAKFNEMTTKTDSYVSSPLAPKIPARNVPKNPSEIAPTAHLSDTSEVNYDREFEKRFKFTPIENLPPPKTWNSPPKPAKNADEN